MLNVLGSMSVNTGLALQYNIQFDEAMKVKGVVMTSSPFFIPKLSNER